VKAFVITNPEGKVVGHVRVQESKSKDTPTPGAPVAPPGHKVHEIELPSELHGIKDARELHKALERHLNQAR
jgi:hypothetical protein